MLTVLLLSASVKSNDKPKSVKSTFSTIYQDIARFNIFMLNVLLMHVLNRECIFSVDCTKPSAVIFPQMTLAKLHWQ